MGRRFSDNALTTLASSITAVSTTLTVATGKGNNFPAVTGHGTPGATPDHFIITLEDAAKNIEKIRVENRAVASDVLGSAGFPLVRGYDGTIARAWNAGDSVDLRFDKSEAQDVEDKVQGSALGRAFGLKGLTTIGLTFGFYGGLVYNGAVLTTVADGTVALTASQTNFVERTLAGVVSANTVGFTAGRVPLYQVATDASGITSITEKRATLMQYTGGGITVPIIDSGTTGSLFLKTNNGETGLEVLRSGTVNWLQIAPQNAGFGPVLQATGGDANVGLSYRTKGTGAHDFHTDSLGLVPLQFRVLHTDSATSRATITGAAAAGTVGATISTNDGRALALGNGRLQFPATQNASADANTLDDYEEGTFTNSLGGTDTFTVNIGTYTKVGRLISIQGSVTVNVIGTGSATVLSGFPFTNGASHSLPIAIGPSDTLATAVVSVVGVIQASSTNMLMRSRTAANAADASNNIFQNGASLNFNGCYFA